MRAGSQHVRATVREPPDGDGRSRQLCRLVAFATPNLFEPLCLIDTHDAGAAVSATAQSASTHTPPAVALAKACKRTAAGAAAPKPEEVSSAEMPPPTRCHRTALYFTLRH